MTHRWLSDARALRHSRSEAAGYSSTLLDRAHVGVVGAGALGQNILLDLALAGVGELTIIDFDRFEDHNVTRSPLYPTASQLRATDGVKASGVARRLVPMLSSRRGLVNYFCSPVEAVPIGALMAFDLVVSAVDSADTRRWLSHICRLLGIPMVEGGFEGSSFNVSSFSALQDDACFSCLSRDAESTLSCTRLARMMAGSDVVPALQTTAAVAGGYAVEAAMERLHGRSPDDFSWVTYGNIRTPRVTSARVSRVESCPVGHTRASRSRSTTVPATLADLAGLLGDGTLVLASPIVISSQCPNCGSWCRPNRPEFLWRRNPFCERCVTGGVSRAGAFPAPEVVDQLPAEQIEARLEGVLPAECGAVAGGGIFAVRRGRELELIRMPGDATPDECLQRPDR
jgi:adenylyltransferase/sulfurtransferase